MVKIIQIIFCACIFLYGQNVFAVTEPQKSLRDMLVNTKNTVEVFPIDEFTTYVHQHTYTLRSSIMHESDLSRELVDWCRILNGKFQVSSEDGTEWREIKPDSDLKFKGPFDSNTYKFTSAYISEHYRCEGVFSVIKVYEKPTARILYRNMTPVTAFIIKHSTKQPFVFKLKNKEHDATMKKLIEARSLPAEGSNPIELFVHRDFMIGAGTFRTVFVYINGICSLAGGNPKNLIEKKDILYEATPLDTYEYLGTKNIKWILICERPEAGNFMVRIDDSHGRFKVKGEFTSNPPVTGLNYIPLKDEEKTVSSQAR